MSTFVAVVYELFSLGIPLLVRRGDCGINKKSRSHRSAADRGRSPRKPDRAQPSTEAVAHTQCFNTHSETSLVIDHPVRAFSERDHFLMARPPLLCKEGNMPLSSFTASIPPLQIVHGPYEIYIWLLPLVVDFIFSRQVGIDPFQDDLCNVQVVRTQHHHMGCTCQIQLSNNPMTIVGHLYAAVSGRFYLRHGRS